MNEQEIWRNFKEGCETSFLLLYREHAPVMYRYGCKLSKDKDLVKDCLQQVYFNLWKNKENLGNPAHTRNYLLKALRLEIIKKSDTKNSPESLPENYHFLTISSCESDLIDLQTDEINQKKIGALLSQLPARQREVIFLKYYMNLSPKEISVVMGLEQASVYKLTYKAIDKLQLLFLKMYTAILLLVFAF
ncbi:sigma-70 family RNA polymerase sigma factor [Pontibacter sp. 172403-2]|uniref:RNA polymerase sigma factor n=1 Tax=Pontibacter rufus TaxID=2791028 RepID=UPI0018AF8E12|nr:sigma-70 family RNA polymerase sigma factor [Pontibacter sp. 172403-2]MBF9254484.1 sigma-70 family RNA polymerase sigma factor [Pontibacter sp. 172403-2]